MAPHRLIAALVASASIALTACASTGTHTQDLSPSPSVPSTPISPSTSSPSTTVSPTSSPPDASNVLTPKVTPPAQAAVDAYIADFNAGIAASRDPVNGDLSFIAKYETGDLRKSTEAAFQTLKSKGLAWRGAPPDPNVKVKAVLSTSAVQLTSCLVVDKADPWVEYTVATGKPVPVPAMSPPPPYLLTIFMKLEGSGWKAYDVLQTRGTTCRG